MAKAKSRPKAKAKAKPAANARAKPAAATKATRAPATRAVAKRASPKVTPKAKAKAKAKPSARKPAARRTPARKATPRPARKAAPTPARQAAAKRRTATTPRAVAKSRAARPPRIVVPTDLAELARVWNEAGRAYYTEYSDRLERYFAEQDEDVDLDMEDPRPEALGEAVLRHVVELAAQGDYLRARELFDPAYSPIFPAIEANKRSLGFVTILGPDELLVRRGAAWEADAITFHLQGGTATVVEDVRGFARSRNRDHLLVARASGLEFRDARVPLARLEAPAVHTLPWPPLEIFRPVGLDPAVEWTPDPESLVDGAPLAVEQLGISDDGMRVVVSCYRQGILLASRRPGEPAWQLLWPDARDRFQPAHADEASGEASAREAPTAGDMTHVALSPDGTRLAYGTQDGGHYLAEIDETGQPAWYATVGHLSEYPHFAWFSDDGRYAALNSCHFYNGVTLAFEWEGNRGAELDAYEEHAAAPVMDGGLRVYAAAWVPRRSLVAIAGESATGAGAFVLAGSGALRFCTPDGEVVAVQGFGSSADSMDYCPETNQLALASYSGMVHVFDPDQEELAGRIDGWRARRERYRWLVWENLPNGPVRW